MIAEGKAKKIHASTDPDKLIFFFKDDATAFNALKKGTVESKGVLQDLGEVSEAYLEIDRRTAQ